MVENPFQFSREDPMGTTYAYVFYGLAVITAVLAWASQPRNAGAMSAEGKNLKYCYLVVWYICVAGDWLQGPYVYALYDAYGFSRREISQLFVAGFGASMLVGTFVGSMADRIGRKRSCQLYCVLYIVSCMTKHCSSYWVLMFGRVTGGVATSLLFSGFESWLVAEATTRRNLDRDTLGHIFALMWWGNSVVAILAGIVGDVVVAFKPLQASSYPTWHHGGFVSPFDLAIVFLCAGLWIITTLWEENYGAPSAQSAAHGQELVSQIRSGVQAVATNHQLLILMMMVAFFEGSMYTFVFNWTPALESKFSTPAYGMVFATFMMAYMCGSSCFDLFRTRGAAPMRMAQVAFGLGASSFLVAGIANHLEVSQPHLTMVLMGFIAFEFCCGLYFPSISTLKSQCVPEATRTTIYNIYRVPMNAIVLSALLTNITMFMVFLVCFGLLTCAGVSTLFFGNVMPADVPQQATPKNTHEDPWKNLEAGEGTAAVRQRPKGR